MSGLSERQLFQGYAVPYDDEDLVPAEPTPPPRQLHTLTPLEIRQRVAAHHDRMAEEHAVAKVRAERERAS